MGAQWKHSLRQGVNEKKGALIGKIVKEIIVATKMGGSDPDSNFRLRGALEDARKNSVPRDTIDRAIKRGSGLLDDTVQYETIVYEGFAPHQVPVLVECLTENRNRSAADVRSRFRKGQIGSAGSVAWMFDRKGMIEAVLPKAKASDVDLEGIAIEAGADSVELYVPEIEPNSPPPKEGLHARFICSSNELDGANRYLSAQNWVILASELAYFIKNPVELTEEQKQEVHDFLDHLNDCDDVHRLYVGLK